MTTVGRGGEGDVGQRIRDEILVIQRNCDCKGGMMEEWHQKLHNNTSPDDVVICEALLNYIKSGFKMDVYWKTLNDNGVTKERMLSYDRPVRSEPKFREDQKDALIRDLTNYLRTLKAVHSGADLESAIQACMGYTAQASRHMGDLKIHPISGLSGALPGLLQYVLEHVEDKTVTPLLEGLLEARRELRPTLLKPHDRLRDIIFLDLALDSTVRTAVERGLETLSNSGPLDLALVISMVVENLALSSNNNEELVYCLKDWNHVIESIKKKGHNWALRTKAVLDRTRLALQDKAEYYQKTLQPTAEYLGALLGVEEWAVNIFTEEMIRSGSAASLSLLLNRLDPVIRKEAHMGSWQVISPVDVKGFIEVVDELEHVQDKVYDRPTILVSGRVKGEEEIPDGAVAVLTPDMPDVLSHVSVRARNGKICFATCFDPDVLADLRKKDKKAVSIQITPNADLSYSDIGAAEVASAVATDNDQAPPPKIILKKKKFVGKYAISADEFTPDLVGAKSRNIANLRGKLPSWIRLPTSVALPFGVFEKVLAESINKDVATEIANLSKQLADGDFSKLKDARATVLGLKAPPALIEELKKTLKGSGMPWPGDESEERWTQAWTAIKRVWASKWNERAYFSTRKAKIDHSDLCMAVLVQEIIQADYAFVIHTTNPSTEDETEIYAEVVKGLGETLVGAYSGRALSFVAKKSDIKNPKVLGYPSKRVGLFIKQSIIFRSDSNGEDLEGYAGAGLYDSVPMDHEEERVVDYSSDHLILDEAFQKTILTKIAEAGYAVEKLLRSAQDIEGVIKDGELYIVQTRPQM
jgi:alpha-glucan,water dikinase